MTTITLAEDTVIDKMVKDGVKDPRTILDRGKAEKEAETLIRSLSGFDSNRANFDEQLPPIIIVRGSKFIAYILVFNPGYLLTAKDSYQIIEKLLPYIEKIHETKKKPILIFYSKKGNLSKTAYLYLGNVIENHNVGILFINGTIDEVLEVLWHLENVGQFTVAEEETIELGDLK